MQIIVRIIRVLYIENEKYQITTNSLELNLISKSKARVEKTLTFLSVAKIYMA